MHSKSPSAAPHTQGRNNPQLGAGLELQGCGLQCAQVRMCRLVERKEETVDASAAGFGRNSAGIAGASTNRKLAANRQLAGTDPSYRRPSCSLLLSPARNQYRIIGGVVIVDVSRIATLGTIHSSWNQARDRKESDRKLYLAKLRCSVPIDIVRGSPK